MTATNGGRQRRKRLGVVIPSTNTSVEADYNDLRPDGVSFHVGRIYIQTKIDTDDDAQTTLRQLRDGMEKAVHDVCTCKPDHMIMGMSSETFVGGLKGSLEMGKRIEEMSGLGVSMGSEATREVLEMLGAKRIAVLTPYQPSIDVEVERYFDDLGYDMVAMKSLRCPTATSIADVTGDEILDAVAELEGQAGSDVDVYVQAGTNLSSWRVADEVESRTGKPLVGINAATVWHALRALGLDASLPNAGRVFRGDFKASAAKGS
jgi:maleate isomerase